MRRRLPLPTSRLATHWPAILATLTVLAFGVMVDVKTRELACRVERDKAAEYLGGLKLRIEDAAQAQFGHLHQLADLLSPGEPRMTPDLQRTVESNTANLDKFLGLALMSHDTGEVMIQGEIPSLDKLTEIVKQGDPAKSGAQHLPGASPQSVAIWSPVITEGETGEAEIWGQAVALVDAQKFFGEAGLSDRSGQYDIAITERVPSSPDKLRGMILGNPGVGSHDPVRTGISIPGGEWTLEIAPAGGWAVPAGSLLPLRGLTLVSAFGVAFLMVRMRNQSERRLESLKSLQRTQIELLEATQRFELALGSSRIGVIDYDVASGDFHWDRTAREQYDIDSDRATSPYKDWLCRIHPEDRAKTDAAFWEAVESRTQFGATFRIVDRLGSTRTIEVAAYCIGDADTSLHVVGLSREVSTPAESRRDAPPLHLAVSQSLDPSGSGPTASLFRRSEIDPRWLAEDLVFRLSVARGDQGISCSVLSSARLPARVRCDSVRLRQVLSDLIGSAIRHAKVGPVVLRLDYETAATGRLVASVENAGLDAGLATCKKIVTAMGGEVTLRSRLGRGARLELRIPAPDATDPRADLHGACQNRSPSPAGAMLARRDLVWSWTRRRGGFGSLRDPVSGGHLIKT